MLPDRVSNPGPLTYESDALPIALRGPANSCEVLNKKKSRGFRASSLSTYGFSTLYTTLSHNLIKDKLVDLTERTFQREGSLYIACNDRNAFFTSDAVRNYNV